MNMDAQIILTCYLILLTITGIYKIGADKHGEYSTPSKTVGATLGFLMKMGSIFLLLWWGGFYA